MVLPPNNIQVLLSSIHWVSLIPEALIRVGDICCSPVNVFSPESSFSLRMLLFLCHLAPGLSS